MSCLLKAFKELIMSLTFKNVKSCTFQFPFKNCQALSISQSLNLSLSLRDRDRADTIITLYHTTTANFLST